MQRSFPHTYPILSVDSPFKDVRRHALTNTLQSTDYKSYILQPTLLPPTFCTIYFYHGRNNVVLINCDSVSHLTQKYRFSGLYLQKKCRTHQSLDKFQIWLVAHPSRSWCCIFSKWLPFEIFAQDNLHVNSMKSIKSPRISFQITYPGDCFEWWHECVHLQIEARGMSLAAHLAPRCQICTAGERTGSTECQKGLYF